MKQEKTRNGKKWIWLVVGLVLLLAIVGVVLAMVLGGGGTKANIPMEGRSDLYWNIDRLTYLKNSMTGQTSREPAEDGLYHIRFAYNGEQIELTAADRSLVNQIDTMDIMGLEIDKDGTSIIRAISADKVAKEIGAPLYVQRTTSGVITANVSAALNSVSVELTITENTQLYDVNPEAETIGAICSIDDIGASDALYVYANGSDEITHIYLVSHPVRSPLYWAAERKYSSSTKETTREPDANGIYTVTAFSDGERIELKFKDKDLVTQIDKKNRHSLHFGCTMDQNGFVIQVMTADEALGATCPADRWFVTEVNGSNVKVQKFGTSPKEYTFNLPEDCPIYDVSKASMVEGRQGQQISSLEWGDRITMWVDGNNQPIVIYVSNALVENVPVYYSTARKYSSKLAQTTREPNSAGYYEFEVYKPGDDGLSTVKTKDLAVASMIDSIGNRIIGMVVDENNIVQRAYDPESIYGYSQFTNGRTVDAIIGPFVTAITIGKPMDTANAAMSTACEIYNASGYGEYGRTLLEVGDHIVANRGFDGYADTDIRAIFISRRLLGKDMMYFILDHSYDSKLKQSTREPDEDGWYRVPVAHQGEQMVVRTKSKAMIDKMESFSPGAVCLELSGDIVVGAYDPAWGTGGKKVTSGYRIVSFGENGTLSANYKTTTTEISLADDVVYYNVSSSYYDHKGEQTSSLQMGDMITAFTNRHGEVEVVYVRGREVKGMYVKTEQMYDAKTKQTTRVPDAEGWYHFDMYCDGEFVSYKTKDKELATKIDSQTYTFGLVVKDGIIRSFVSTSWVKGVSGTAYGGWDVMAVNGNNITVKYNTPGSSNTGVTKTMRINANTKIYDISPTGENFGQKTTIKVGDRIRAFSSESNKEIMEYVYVTSHDTRKDGQVAYCEHCDKEVFWNPWLGGSFGKGDGHYYLNADVETINALSVYNEDLQYEVVLDLNGNTYHVEGKRAFAVYRGETMTIMDSVGGGCLSATGATGGYGGVFTVLSKGTLNLLSGTIKGVESEDQTVVYGGAIYSTANINIYGGEVIGGVTKADETLGKLTPYGGAIMTSGATVNMYGGKISGGSAPSGRGGNIYLTSSTFNMYGGEIVDGNASHGGNIYVSNSTFNMAGGKISGGVATNGGNAYIYSKGQLITSGDAMITGGVSNRVASRNNGGGNIFVYLKGAVLMEGGSITDGQAVSYGGNITCRGGELIVKDGVISGGKSETGGDNVYINGAADADTMFVAAGGKIVDGNVYIHKPAEEGRINAGLTGTPVIEELDLTSGAIFEMYDLKKGASVTVNGAGTLSAPYKYAKDYAETGYIKHIDSKKVIKAAEDNTLYVAQYCEHCGKEVQWLNWNGEMLNTADTVDGGHYMLMKDIATSSQIRVGAEAVEDDPKTTDKDETAAAVSVTVCVDLNGHNITNSTRAFAVYNDSTLNLMNSSETESIVHGAYNADAGGVINLGGASNLSLYGNISLQGTAETFGRRGGVVNMSKGVFNMYGGTLIGQVASSGGAVYVGGGTFNMYGGLITGGTATSSGGNVYVSGTMNISGGTIEKGFADGSASSSNGGNIYIAKGELNVSGDAIIRDGNGTRSAARTNGGGNIYGQDKTVINISGGQILNGTATSFGGNVYGRGAVNISGGKISGGTAANGGNVFVSGYAVPATLTITGGIIENGTATTGELDALKEMVKEAYDGDNIYITSATATITGGKIADNDGGNAILAFTSKTERPGIVILTLANNEELIAGLDSKVYAVSGAQIAADQGGLKTDNDGDKVWCVEGYDEVAPTEPSTVPTEPSQPTEPTGPVDTEHVCEHCGQVVTWTEWDGSSLNTTSVVNGGHYILTKDVDTSSQIRIGADAVKDDPETTDKDETAEAIVVSVCIDLNGHSITNKARAFAVYAGSTLTLVNSSNTESVITGAYNKDVGGVINLGGASNLNLYGNISLNSSAETFEKKGGLVNMSTGTFNMYGGTLNGRSAASGGAVYVNGGTFNLVGGLITGGSATSSGGNIYLNGGKVNISGGIVENGLADGSASSSNGGNIYIAKGELNISGDAIIRGGNGTRSAARTNGGGNIYGQDKTVINISGGTIENGTAVSFGGNVYSRGTLTISGGKISGGTAANGGNVFINGYNYADASLTVTGGTIENGTITTGELCNKNLMVKDSYDGSNIYVSSATANISGGVITDNDGGNAILAFTSKEANVATVKLTLADKADLAAALEGKIYLVTGAEIETDIGVVITNADNDKVWYKETPATEPTEPSTAPTEPSTAPTEPSTAPTEPSTAPTEPSVPGTEPSVPGTEPSTEPSQPAGETCPHCKQAVVWTEWDGDYLNTADLNGGHFVLTQDLTSGGQIVVGADAKVDNTETPDVDETADAVAVTVCVDLNGHAITKAGRVFAIYAGSTLNLMNTSETESVVTGSYNKDRGGVINLSGTSNMNLYEGVKLVGAAEVTEAAPDGFKYNGGVVALAGGNFTMYGGTVVGQHATNGGAIYTDSGNVTVAGGTVHGGTATLGGAIYVNGGSLVISDGLITGGTATSETSHPYGGNVYVEGSDFAMTGGKIADGVAASTAKTPGGANLYLRASSASLTITGGVIENGVATNGNGGNIYLNVGTLNISGDVQIIGGQSTRNVARTNGGGNIYAQVSTTLNIDGGKILNGTSASYGGNVLSRGTILVTNGLISGGSALNGGNIFINGYDRVATCTVSGGTIENGTATTGKIDRTENDLGYDGDNIYVNSAVLNISGGMITDDDGGNAVLAFTHPNSVKDGKEFGAVINLTLTDKADLAAALDGKIYLVSGAQISSDIGGTDDNSGDLIWYKEAPPVEPSETTAPTEPSTEATTAPTEPSTEATTAPTEPSTEATTAPTEPSTEATTAPTEPSTEATEPSTAPVEKCPHCDEEIANISYVEWTGVSGGTISESGHYYLTANVEGINSQMKIGENVDAYIDLRGNSFLATNVRIFSVSAGGTLTIVDTVGGGELQGGGNGGNVINLAAGATFNLYDATLTNVRATESTSMGGVVNTTDGSETSYSVFNMYSGTLNGGNHAGNGGAIAVRKFAQFNMYGGTVYGATCTTADKTPVGAAIAVRAQSSVVHIYDGSVIGGVSEGVGDCMHVAAGATVIVEGGCFLDGDVYIKTVGENAIVLSGQVEIENLDLTSGGIITIGEGGFSGIVKVNANEGIVCAASEHAGISGSSLVSLNPDLQFAVDANQQVILVPVVQNTRALANAAIAGVLKNNLLNP